MMRPLQATARDKIIMIVNKQSQVLSPTVTYSCSSDPSAVSHTDSVRAGNQKEVKNKCVRKGCGGSHFVSNCTWLTVQQEKEVGSHLTFTV